MDVTVIEQRTELQEVQAKFMLLLDTDRTSAEFERLYAEVDEALTRMTELHSPAGERAS